MKAALSLLIPFVFLLFPQKKEQFHYGTKSPEARAAYLKGWEQILDHGEWTLAEASFRKAVNLDSGFLLAWSQVGRISKNAEERSRIYWRLANHKSLESDWENKLLEVYLSSLRLIDSKDLGLSITREQISEFYTLSESHFSDFLKVHPNEDYIYSEYIEVIHGIYGPKAALDTLQKQAVKGKKLNPFLISYTAQMQAELKDFEGALETVENLKESLDTAELPIVPFTYAFIQYEMRDYRSADNYLDQTLAFDPNHTLAQRLKRRVQDILIGH
jgi:tetratricopeptide (TPR) repeat protein